MAIYATNSLSLLYERVDDAYTVSKNKAKLSASTPPTAYRALVCWNNDPKHEIVESWIFFFARTLNVITHYFTEKQTKSQKVQKSSDKSSSLSSSLLSSSPNNSAIALTDKPSGHSLGIYLP